MAGTYVALVRGINVGRAKRVAMSDLRKLVEGLGYRDVRTLLNSGNIVFTAPSAVRGDPAARIQKSLAARLGVSARVMLLSAAEIGAVVSQNPLAHVAVDPSRFLVAVPADQADLARLKPLTAQKWSPEEISLGKHVAYLWCARGILESPLLTAMNKVLEDRVTTRNFATMMKLHALVGGTRQ